MGDYVGAPYNFVPFGKKVYRKKEIVKYNQIQGLSGYIEYLLIFYLYFLSNMYSKTTYTIF